MTDVTATVKVRSPDGSSEKPERERVERAAELLKESGFAIQRLGRFGISIVGKDHDFARVLGVAAEPGKALAAAVKANKAELNELLENVEIVPKPKLF
jgi:hypothetical protein